MLSSPRGHLDGFGRWRPVAEGVAYAMRGQAEVALRCEDLLQATALASSARRMFERLPYPIGVAYTTYSIRSLSHIALASGKVDEALARAREALAIFRRLQKPRGIAYMEQTMAVIARRGGLPPPANRTDSARTRSSAIWLAPLPTVLRSPRA